VSICFVSVHVGERRLQASVCVCVCVCGRGWGWSGRLDLEVDGCGWVLGVWVV